MSHEDSERVIVIHGFQNRRYVRGAKKVVINTADEKGTGGGTGIGVDGAGGMSFGAGVSACLRAGIGASIKRGFFSASKCDDRCLIGQQLNSGFFQNGTVSADTAATAVSVAVDGVFAQRGVNGRKGGYNSLFRAILSVVII